MLLMFGYLTKSFWTTHPQTAGAYISRTDWSLGILGNKNGNPPGQTRVSIAVTRDGNSITAENENAGGFNLNSTVARCVKDVYDVSIDD